MDREAINRNLFFLASWNAPEHKEARGAFVREMKHRQFGGEALRDAWEFFLYGWQAAKGKQE